MNKTPEQMADKHANWRCPEQGPEFIVWCMCKEDFLAGYQAAQQWISVKDRLPKIDQWCSWWDINGATEPCTAFRDVNDIETWWENYTHWMPLPAAPKEEE